MRVRKLLLLAFSVTALGVMGSRVASQPQSGEASGPRFETDQMTGTKNVRWHTFALAPISGTFSGKIHPRLDVRCVRQETEVAVSWGRFITTDSRGTRVLSRIGSRPHSQAGWGISTDFKATFAPKPIALLKQMTGETRFLVEVVPYASPAVRAEFDLTGIAEAVAAISKACGWAAKG